MRQRSIPGFPGYEIDEYGQVTSYKFKVPRKLKQYRMPDGYWKYRLFDIECVAKDVLVHRLVALTWIPNPENLPIVLHRDDNKDNNHVSNLKWGTIAENNVWNGLNIRKGPLISAAVRGKQIGKSNSNYRGENYHERVAVPRASFKKACLVRGCKVEDFKEVYAHTKNYGKTQLHYYFYIKREDI